MLLEKKKINFLLILLVCFRSEASPELEIELSNLESKISLSERFNKDGDIILKSTNIRINNCDSYPYYNQSESHTNELIDSLIKGVSGLRQCFDGRIGDPSLYLKEKMNNYISLMGNGDIEKYITCDFGKANSWLAIATENKNSSAIEKYPVIKKYPGMIINTNRVSGNFRLGMSDKDITNTYRFYGGRLPLESIKSGEINPLYNYITNPTSLVIHETLHWTDTVHSNKDYPDIIYLTQACCFEQSTLDSETKEKACAALFNKDMYQKDKEARLEAQRAYNVRGLVKSINSLLHKASNKHRAH